ncbi:GPP34 family phosphoprotein [Actinomycetospora sp. TBRC 11914]|uniref:GPP34 family phosphoprotein n=1 Tax=Actinomycetospora sp. TBRC 11914 TaxID=2729387 RepID=UPI00145F4A51|nr:GPP34 family phosphoprotein [Actinomycetospora sp. TBRC 11914]NMO88855.1 GPP34 family phosphoprotein [Actinomycetospora sp. TBRC 11914]
MRSERWSAPTRELTLPERIAWVLGNEDGRPVSSLTEPAGLLVAAALVELLLDASLLDAGSSYRRGPVDTTDPLLEWAADGLLRSGGRKADLGHAVTGPRGAQMIRRTMDRLVERGLAHREPRRVFGYLAMPVFGSALRVHETAALHHDRAVVRAVLDGADADEDTAMIAVLLHHGRRVRALHPQDPHAAIARARSIASGRFVPAGIDQDIVRLVSPTVQAVLAALTATEVLSSGH